MEGTIDSVHWVCADGGGFGWKCHGSGLEVCLERISRTVRLLRLCECLAKRCDDVVGCGSLDLAEYEQRVRVQFDPMN